MKTLVIHGNEDLVLPVQTIMSTASALGKLELWEKGGHMIPLEDTELYLKQIKEFIKS